MANTVQTVSNYRIPVPIRLPRYMAEQLPRPIGPHIEALITNSQEACRLLDAVARDTTIKPALRERSRLLAQAMRGVQP